MTVILVKTPKVRVLDFISKQFRIFNIWRAGQHSEEMGESNVYRMKQTCLSASPLSYYLSVIRGGVMLTLGPGNVSNLITIRIYSWGLPCSNIILTIPSAQALGGSGVVQFSVMLMVHGSLCLYNTLRRNKAIKIRLKSFSLIAS